MPAQLIRRTRDKQPKRFISIDKDNAIVDKLCFAWVPTNKSNDLATCKKILIEGTQPEIYERAWLAAAIGVGAGNFSAGSRPDVFPSGSDKLTVFVVATDINTATCSGSIIGKVYSDWNFRINIDSGAQQIVCSMAGTSSAVSYPASSVANGLLHLANRAVPMALVYDGTNVSFYYDGKLGNSAAKTGTATAPNDSLSILSRGDTGDRMSGARIALAFIFNRALSPYEVKTLSDNPWQVFEPETIPLFYSTVTAQYARPTSDVSAGTWTASTGSDLFAMLDETTESDADYIVTTGTSTCEVALTSLSDPASSTGHIVRYRISATSGGITVRLRQGAATIATWTHASAPTSLTTYAQTLTGGEADSITSYDSLSLQFEAV